MISGRISNWLAKYKYPLSFISIGLIYFLNLFIDIMEIDAAQYASIAREMMSSPNILQVYERGVDYLDKPPLLFWLSAATMKLFGVADYTFKLPAVLIIILGIYSTYRFSLLYYSKTTAITAALMLGSSQAFFLMTNDVRMDGILTGLMMFSLWQLNAYINQARFLNLILAAIGSAGALMAKGPLALVIIAFAFGGGLLLNRDWKNIFKTSWIVYLLMVLILLLPMLYGLYTQFDLHPEKYVYGLQGPSGVKFFFWTQSFGRITGDLYWSNDLGYFFFFHSILWDFQPWVLLFIPALLLSFAKMIYPKLPSAAIPEWMSLSGFVLSFASLSLSHYKLPHYIFTLFPFAAIITANFVINNFNYKALWIRLWLKIQYVLLFAFFALLLISFIFFFPPQNFWIPLLLGTLFLVFIFSLFKIKSMPNRLIYNTLIASISFNLLLSIYFYPSILKYQSSSVLGKEILQMKLQGEELYVFPFYAPALDFYANERIPYIERRDLHTLKQGTYVFTDLSGKNLILETKQLNYKIIRDYDQYPVTILTMPFLNKETRKEKLTKRYLIQRGDPKEDKGQ
jgi:4-amino-4-deoxy-L-arabinose transferase-like glycosyltransferase